MGGSNGKEARTDPNHAAAPVVPETEGFRDPGTAVQVAVCNTAHLQYGACAALALLNHMDGDSGSCQMDRGNGSQWAEKKRCY